MENKDTQKHENPTSIIPFKFGGGRFDEVRGMPAEALAEISRYQKLVKAVARDLYYAQNPTQKKLPDGYLDKFNFSVQNIKDGSAAPCLVYQSKHKNSLLDTVQTVTDTFASIAKTGKHPASTKLSFKTLESFGSFGSCMQESEKLYFANVLEGANEWKPENTINREAIAEFQKLLKDIKNQENAYLAGYVTSFNPLKQTFGFKELSSSKVLNASYRDQDLASDIKNFLVLPRHAQTFKITRLICDYEQDLRTIRKITDVKSVELFSVQDSPWADRLIELLKFKPGWFDGDGEAIPVDLVERADEILTMLNAGNSNRPGIFPVPEGGVLLESNKRGFHVSVEICADEELMYGFYYNPSTNKTVEVDLNTSTDAAHFLEEHLRGL